MEQNLNEKKNWYYYRVYDGPGDRPIFQYMRLDYLIQLLETSKYFVRRRREYIDANESYYNKKLEFGFTSVDSNVPQQLKSTKRSMIFRDIIDCPTSCWTKTECESYLMWKNYATDVGVRIKTTVHNLIAALMLDLDKNGSDKVFCGSMVYTDCVPSVTEIGQMFNKDEGYADENEFRFYFLLSVDKDKKCTTHRLIPISPLVMIEEILISPFICKAAADKLVRMIKCSYGIDNVKQSKIKII